MGLIVKDITFFFQRRKKEFSKLIATNHGFGDSTLDNKRLFAEETP